MIGAGFVVKTVLLLLLFFSVASWAIIFFKHRYLSSAGRQTALFVRQLNAVREPEGLFSLSRRYPLSPASNVFRAVFADSLRERAEVRRAIKRYEALETAKLERYLGFLATTGSVTPFIGLFGTVWGIMDSFRGIGAHGAASLAVVAPGIAEALVATAVGLVAAIPAVIAYNYYLARTERMIIEMQDISEETLELLTVARHEA